LTSPYIPLSFPLLKFPQAPPPPLAEETELELNNDNCHTITYEEIRLRREALFRAGRLLANEMEATAWNPGNLMVGIAIHKNPSISMVKAVE